MAKSGLRKAVKTVRGKHGTTGARLTLGALAGLGHAATALGMMHAHGKLRAAQMSRIRERLNSREVARA